MKRIIYFLLVLSSLFGLSSCAGNDTDDLTDTSGDANSASTTTEGSVTTNGDVSTFSIGLDKTALDETLTVDNSDDDYIENTTFADTAYVNFSTAGAATVTGHAAAYATVSGNDVTVNYTGSDNVLYVLSGTTADGFFKLYSSKKQGIKLNGVSITNPNGAAINNQSKKRTFIVLGAGTKNYLTDGTGYSDAISSEDMKGTLFSEGQLVFSGSGYLEVDANSKAGISSDDYVRFMPLCNVYVDASAGNGIRGKDAVIVTGGVINVNVTGTADKGISTDGVFQLDGGRTTVLTGGGYEWDSDDNDYSACAGVKSDSLVTINAGKLYLKSTGIGGKGISCDDRVNILGGDVKVITTGKSYPTNTENATYSTSPKGIKADGNLTVSGGSVQVRSSYSEGIESKGTITINGGTIESYCYDDAINSSGNLTINGGYIYAHGSNNDAIDANMNMYINGGEVIAEGTKTPECGLDAAEGYSLFINGGTVIALGGDIQQTSSSSKQPSVTTTVSAGTTVALLSGSTALLTYAVPSGQSTALMISCPSLKSGSSYSFRSGVTVSGGATFYGLTLGGTVSGGTTSSSSLTAAYQVGSAMGGGGRMR